MTISSLVKKNITSGTSREQLLNEDHGFFLAGERQQCSGAHGKKLTVGSTLSGGTSSTAEGVKKVWRNLFGEGVEMIGHKATEKSYLFIFYLPQKSFPFLFWGYT